MAESARAGLAAAIASITAVGLGISLAIPLLSITLDDRGISAGWIGINAAAWGLASMAATPFVPPLAARFGTRATLAIAVLLVAASLPLFYLAENFWLWFPLRIVSGASVAAAFILSEYWITTAARPERRGFVMGLYATVLSIGLALGPVILGITGTSGFRPFVIGAIIIALAALPIALAEAPTVSGRSEGGFLKFLVVAPAATGAALAFGFAESGSFAILPVYGEHNGHAVNGVVLFAAAMTFGNVLFQVPFGHISDRADRRKLLFWIALLGLIGAALLPAVSASLYATIILLFFWGGTIGALYTVGLAHLAQRFTGPNLAAANSAFVFCYASGSLVGPAALGLGMEAYDPQGFAIVLALCFLAYVVLVGMRIMIGTPGRGPSP